MTKGCNNIIDIQAGRALLKEYNQKTLENIQDVGTKKSCIYVNSSFAVLVVLAGFTKRAHIPSPSFSASSLVHFPTLVTADVYLLIWMSYLVY